MRLAIDAVWVLVFAVDIGAVAFAVIWSLT